MGGICALAGIASLIIAIVALKRGLEDRQHDQGVQVVADKDGYEPIGRVVDDMVLHDMTVENPEEQIGEWE